jgi:hypothetical protein
LSASVTTVGEMSGPGVAVAKVLMCTVLTALTTTAVEVTGADDWLAPVGALAVDEHAIRPSRAATTAIRTSGQYEP